jgi:hypothetical protein
MARVRVAVSEGESERRWLRSGVVVRLIGVAAILSGGAVLLTLVWRFLGYSYNGGSMNDPGGAWAITRVALLTVVTGIVILSVARKREPRATPAWMIAGAVGVVLVVFAPVALARWYPATDFATVVAYDAATGEVFWEAATPATHIFAIEDTGDGLAIRARIDEPRCGDFRFVTFQLDPTTGQRVRPTSGVDGNGPWVPGGVWGQPGPRASGLRWDRPAGRIVSDRGWSVKVDPNRGDVPALVTPDVVYMGLQGGDWLSCSY